ncbi:hypothetical protein [Deminuibacter soli]|uniref:Uncharacterized protein n=1 Tax=Deminuibacter soli TaxID=2291815 RepID=A0A3E1NQ13_9BACT|nr:hypothetical protein [Deminuibacter soli]RFM30013.1 hypothetical protein DXN05_03310 [Deminuibacter soli]
MKKINKDGRADNGGARKGAGRPKKRGRVWLSLPVELAERINALPNRNQAAEVAFDDYFKRNEL